MKIRLEKQQASVLVIAAILIFVVGTTLASYLVLNSNEAREVARSQKWNTALDMAEAGIEEGLEQANTAGLGTSPNLAANGWGGSGTNFGPVTRTAISGGSYTVSIDTSAGTPTVTSTGFATNPITGTVIQRTVRVTTGQSPLINAAFAAVNSITMNGNTIAADSWSSTDTNLSTNGHYDASKVSTNGNVASEDGVVNLGNDTVMGSLYLGPTATLASSSNNITGTIFYDYNVQIPSVQEPAGVTWVSAPSSGGNHYFTNSIYNGGYYNISDNGQIVVGGCISVTVRVLSSSVTSFNPSAITINTNGSGQGGTLNIYQQAGSMTMSGNITVNSQEPSNLWYYGESSVTNITFSGTTAFIGVIYAPQATMTDNGGGHNVGVLGSAIVGTLSMHGHYDFHYDQSLSTDGPNRGFIAASWREL